MSSPAPRRPRDGGQPPRGRPRSRAAEDAILKATLHLLRRKPLCEITADAIASRAGVSKATIYKWWLNKNRVALDAFLSEMREPSPIPDTGSTLCDFVEQLKAATRFYAGPDGRVLRQFLAEGQGDAEFLAVVRERFQQPRRRALRVLWDRGLARGDVRPDVDFELVLDLIFGPMVYRLLGRHNPLTDAAAEAIVRTVFQGVACDPMPPAP